MAWLGHRMASAGHHMAGGRHTVVGRHAALRMDLLHMVAADLQGQWEKCSIDFVCT